MAVVAVVAAAVAAVAAAAAVVVPAVAGAATSTAVGWQYDTYYRFVLSSDGTSTRLSFQTSTGTEIAGKTVDQGFGSLGTFDVAITQRMGTPGGQYYSDVALDNLDFALVPEPGTTMLCALGLIAIVLGKIFFNRGFRGRRRSQGS